MKYLAVLLVFMLPAAGLALVISLLTKESEYKSSKEEELAKVEFKPAPKDTLADYGAILESPIEDMRKLHTLIGTALKAVDAGPADYCTNIADVSHLMIGKNPLKQEFIPKDHHIFNKKGLLVDRWNRVLDIRFDVPNGYTLRSHGPDETANTADDVFWPLK